MERLIAVTRKSDIEEKYLNTPIGLLLEYHNLKKNFEVYQNAEIIIGTCMDNRLYLDIPKNFAYMIRTGGANLQHSDFYISYAVAIGKISAIALIAHNHCGMVNLNLIRGPFIQGLIHDAGWEQNLAEAYFTQRAPPAEIKNEIDFILSETDRLHRQFPKTLIAPLFYRLEDHLLYLT